MKCKPDVDHSGTSIPCMFSKLQYAEHAESVNYIFRIKLVAIIVRIRTQMFQAVLVH